jgi:hypothetical protein
MARNDFARRVASPKESRASSRRVAETIVGVPLRVTESLRWDG